jgi:hypothetical protein
MQSDAITPLQSVPQSLAAIMGERKDRSKLGLSKYDGEAAEQAAEHKEKLGMASKVKDVAGVHKRPWPEETHSELIDGGIFIALRRCWMLMRTKLKWKAAPDAR